MRDVEKLQKELEAVRKQRLAIEKRLQYTGREESIKPKVKIPKFKMPTFSLQTKVFVRYTLMVSLFLIILFLIFAYWPEKEVKSEFKIPNVLICDDVVNNICIPNVDGVYERGSRVHIVTLVENLMKIDGKINYEQFFEIYSPDGELIEEVSGLRLKEEKKFKGSLINLRYNFLTEESDASGEYSVTIIVRDVNLGVSQRKNVKFSIK